MKSREWLVKLILILLCSILFMCHLGSALPIIESEKFYYQSVKEMFARHDWLTPYYQGRFRFQKPILFYWLVSLSYLIFGITNFGVRFPSVLFGVLTVVFTFNIGRKLFDRKTGLLAAGLLATCVIFYMYARYASPDMALTFFITYAIYLFIKGTKSTEGGWSRYAFFFIVLGFATLNKGYVGFALPLIVVFTFVVWTKKWKIIKSLNIPLGVFLILVVALPWYVLMYKLHGEHYLNHIFVRETIMRIFYAPKNEQGIAFLKSYFLRFFYYVPIVLVWFAPHSLFLPNALADAFKSKNTYSREKDAYKLILSFFLGIFVFFTLISVKEYHYVLPIAPAASLLIARYLINHEERRTLFKSTSFILFYWILVVLYAVAILLLLYTMRHLYPSRVALYEYAILVTPLMLIMPFLRKDIRRTYTALPVAMGILLLFLGARAVPLLNDQAMFKIADAIKQDLKEGDKIGVGSVDISQQRLGIYLNRNIEEANMKWRSPKAIPVHKVRIEKFLGSGDNVYLVISREDYDFYVSDNRKKDLMLIDKRETWKTRMKRSFSKEIVMEVLRGEKDLLKDVLRHEVYVLTNKKGI